MFELWLVIFLALVIFEAVTVNLVSVWFAFGALAASITTFFTSDVTIQLVVFVIVSAFSLFTTRPFVKRFIGGRISVPTNLDRVIGKVGIVTMKITDMMPGEVKVDGKKWMAVSNEDISPNSKVNILSIDGVKLNVEKLKEDF